MDHVKEIAVYFCKDTLGTSNFALSVKPHIPHHRIHPRWKENNNNNIRTSPSSSLRSGGQFLKDQPQLQCVYEKHAAINLLLIFSLLFSIFYFGRLWCSFIRPEYYYSTSVQTKHVCTYRTRWLQASSLTCSSSSSLPARLLEL